MSKESEIVFLSSARTPFGTFGGSLKAISAVDLAVHSSKAAIERAGISAEDVDHTIMGNVLYTANDTAYLSRHIALKSGCRIDSPALTVNRLCGSGFQAVISGAYEILNGGSNVCLVGGTESMSQAPHITRGLRWGLPLGTSPVLEDALSEGLRDSFCSMGMGDTAEKLGAQYGITRAQSDEFSLRSQNLAKKAWDEGVYSDEVVPIEFFNPKTKSSELLKHDEHMRPNSTIEGLAKLKPVFKKDGLVTAGSASGIGDGAGSIVISSSRFAEERGLKPVARLVSWGVAGVDPSIMGIGPVPAVRQALQRANLTMDDMDIIEVNEAFAAQTLAVADELKLPMDKLNIHGGAIALSHPLGASGARITTHLLHVLRNSSKRYALGSACIGGGQGIAIIIESLSNS